MSTSQRKRVLVTGSSAGLGKALCDILANSGWHVVSIDREKAGHGQSDHIQCNLSDRSAVETVIKRLSEKDGFDLIIHNAGASATGRFEKIPPHIYQKLMQLNVITPMILTSQLAAANKLTKGGHLVFISSLSHFTGYPGAAVYSATKDAIAIYAKSIRKPFAKIGVRVSCVFPGPMKTNQAKRHSPPGAQEEKRMAPEVAAQLILADVFKNKKTIFPGLNTRLFASLGKVLPFVTDYAMRKIIYEKLNKDVY